MMVVSMMIKNRYFIRWWISDSIKNQAEAKNEEPRETDKLKENNFANEYRQDENGSISSKNTSFIDSESLLIRLKDRLKKTSQQIGRNLMNLISGKKVDEHLLDKIEDHLLMADVGMNTVNELIKVIKNNTYSQSSSNNVEIIHRILTTKMIQILNKVEKPLELDSHKPFIILIIGVNGTGKTTTIAKIAHLLQYQTNKSVMLAAADTFRVGAIEQLKLWGQINHIPVISKHRGADSASVIFEAIQSAKAKNIDVLIADTAGRLHNNFFLMEELKKIIRIIKKIDETAPHEVMLVIDANTGQNSINQLRLFHEATHVTGLTLTKLDGTAKGGILLNLASTFEIPIRYIGFGEGLEDLQGFSSNDFIKALFSEWK
ncbi:MAG: signal recognition particle-docking protein FtsY [Candidatus Dasytiphilus stammeri]